jgi:hypothetical protein
MESRLCQAGALAGKLPGMAGIGKSLHRLIGKNEAKHRRLEFASYTVRLILVTMLGKGIGFDCIRGIINHFDHDLRLHHRSWHGHDCCDGVQPVP